jgi:hypothetical protein
LSIRDIADGASNTVGYGEWRIGDGNPSVISIPSGLNLRGRELLCRKLELVQSLRYV